MVHDTNFLITAGYDSHGANKPDVLIGDEVLAESAFGNVIIARVTKTI